MGIYAGYGAFNNDTSTSIYGFNYDTGAYSLPGMKCGLTTALHRLIGLMEQFVGSVDRSYPLSGSTKHIFGLGGTVEASTVNSQPDLGYNPYSIMFNYGITTMFASKVRFEYKTALLGYTDSGNNQPRREWSILVRGVKRRSSSK